MRRTSQPPTAEDSSDERAALIWPVPVLCPFSAPVVLLRGRWRLCPTTPVDLCLMLAVTIQTLRSASTPRSRSVNAQARAPIACSTFIKRFVFVPPFSMNPQGS